MEFVIFKKLYSVYVMNILDYDNIIIYNFWYVCYDVCKIFWLEI